MAILGYICWFTRKVIECNLFFVIQKIDLIVGVKLLTQVKYDFKQVRTVYMYFCFSTDILTNTKTMILETPVLKNLQKKTEFKHELDL